MKHSLHYLIILASALTLGACTLQFDTTIADTGAGVLKWEYGLNKEEIKALADKGTSPDEFCNKIQSQGNAPPEAVIAKEQRGEEFYCVITTPFKNLAELRSAYAAIDGVTINTLELANNKLVYDIDVHISANDPQLGGLQPLIAWKLTPPGAVDSHNADKVEGDTLIWNFKVGEQRRIQAESSTGILAFLRKNILILAGAGLCGLAGLSLLGGLYWLARRKKK